MTKAVNFRLSLNKPVNLYVLGERNLVWCRVFKFPPHYMTGSQILVVTVLVL